MMRLLLSILLSPLAPFSLFLREQLTLQDHALQIVSDKIFDTSYLLGYFKQDHTYMVNQISQILM